MRIHCQVEIHNRLCEGTNQTQSRRVKSTLAIGGYGGCKEKLWIIHQTMQNGAGMKYKVNSNIIGVFIKFIKEGKTTLRLKEPPVDLRIQGEPLELQRFVEILRHFIVGKSTESSKNLKVTNLDRIPKTYEQPPLKKLKVCTMKEFNGVKGKYPSSLEQLHINNIKLEAIDPKIFRLQHLKVLNLEGNKIQKIPKTIELLSNLSELYLADNSIGQSKREVDWDWLRSKTLQSSLTYLDLTGNEISALPNCFSYLSSLRTLKLDDNLLTSLPNNLPPKESLRSLSLKMNSLRWLPAKLLFYRFQFIDVSENSYDNGIPLNNQSEYSVNLKDLAARAVLFHRIPFSPSVIPKELVRHLESASICMKCTKPSYPSKPRSFKQVPRKQLSGSTDYLNEEITIGYSDCLFKCTR